VATEILDDGEPVPFGECLDYIADIGQGGPRPHLLDPEHERLVCHVDEALCAHTDLSDRKHSAGVAVPAVENDCDVDVEDVALVQPALAGDAVADYVFDRGAD